MSRGTRTKVISLITAGRSIAIVSERSIPSPRSSISAFSFRSRTIALRVVQTLRGS
jgi:hypothetical protein